jgi:hypothetical protein
MRLACAGFFFVAVATTGLVSCFDTPKPACSFFCGTGGVCPADYQCATDGICKLAGLADDFACAGFVVADGSGGPADAAVDATPGSLGAGCSSATECDSGFCVDNVCCDSPCAGACQACSRAAGASSSGTCALLGSAFECRPAASDCDAAEVCDGANPTCPADALAASGTPCGPGVAQPICNPDVCDGAGTCTDVAPAANNTQCGLDPVCDPDVCMNGTCIDAPLAAVGTACGPGVNEPQCNPDQCDGAGNCVDVAPAADGTPCGAGVAEPICNPDVCMSGACLNVAQAATGTVCGDPDPTDCQRSECNASGVCQVNSGRHPAGTPCGTEPDCSGKTCTGGGNCQAGTPAADGTVCDDNGGTVCCSATCQTTCP